MNLKTAVEADVGANSFAHSANYVRMNSHPRIPFNGMNFLINYTELFFPG